LSSTFHTILGAISPPKRFSETGPWHIVAHTHTWQQPDADLIGRDLLAGLVPRDDGGGGALGGTRQHHAVALDDILLPRGVGGDGGHSCGGDEAMNTRGQYNRQRK
jgi:hypothetical protein